MRSRFFHRPIFHHDNLRFKKRANWLELFYDLIYVAVFIQLGNVFSADISSGSFLLSVIVFLSFWVAWAGYTFYSHRYSVDDVLHRIGVFLHMFCVGTLAVSLPDVFNGDYRTFSIVYALSQFIVAALYLRSYLQETVGKSYTQFWGIVFFSSGAL